MGMPSPRPSPAAFGDAVREMRLAQKRTIEALAADANMHWTYLSRIERAKNNPTLGKLRNLASALGVPLSELVRLAETLDEQA